MPSYNKVIIMGHLTRDPEVKYTPNGSAVANISLAMKRKYKTDAGMQEDTTFAEVTVWGKQAETSGQYLSKGKVALVEGRLSLDTWEDKDSGKKRSKLFVTAERVQFMSAPDEQQGGQPNPAQHASGNQAQQNPTYQYNGAQDGMAQDYNQAPYQQPQAPVNNAPQIPPPQQPNPAPGMQGAPGGEDDIPF